MKQLTWLRIVHSGDWCLCLVICTPSGTCQKWMNEWIKLTTGSLSIADSKWLQHSWTCVTTSQLLRGLVFCEEFRLFRTVRGWPGLTVTTAVQMYLQPTNFIWAHLYSVITWDRNQFSSKRRASILKTTTLSLSFRLWIPQVRGQPHGFFFSIQLDALQPPRWAASPPCCTWRRRSISFSVFL